MALQISRPSEPTLNVTHPPVGDIDVYYNRGDQGVAGSPGLLPVFTLQGDLLEYAGKSRFYMEANRTLSKVRASVGTAPTGSAIQVALLIDGVTVETVSIPAGSNTATLDVSRSITAGSYLTVSVLAVGSTTPGSDLTVTLTFN